MSSYDYLWWDNPQLHKGGGCAATSVGTPACVSLPLCMYALSLRGMCVCVIAERALAHQKIHLEVI